MKGANITIIEGGGSYNKLCGEIRFMRGGRKEFKMVDSVMTTEQKKQILAMNECMRELARRWKK